MASYQAGTTYQADSDADDEFERSVMASPTQAHTDSSDNSSDVPSNEHTPTTFGPGFDDGIRPRTIISSWTPDECAHFIASLGLRQYSETFIEHGIDGEALIALKHDELKEMGLASAGHRLKILKGVYDIKAQQDVPVEADDYVPPSAETNLRHEMATKDDILKLTNAILKLRDDRIAQLEAQLTKVADDSRRLRTELWPLFKMVKENQPLPGRPFEISMASPDYVEPVVSPPLPSAEVEKPKSSLTRTFSKKLGLSSGTPKNHSPTHIPNTIPEGRELTGLQPSAAANAASNQLTAGMSGGSAMPHHSPNPNSPTSPMPPQHQPLAPRSYQREHSSSFTSRYNAANNDGVVDVSEYVRNNPAPTPPTVSSYADIPRSSTSIGNKNNNTLSNASTLVPSREMSASVPPPQSSRDRAPPKDKQSSSTTHTDLDPDDPAVQIFKSFRVALDDPCWKVLPTALRKYNIQADWRQYALYIVYGDQERCVGLEEKPLALFKDLDREGKKPMFMLRKLANAAGDVPVSGGQLGGPGLGQRPPGPGSGGVGVGLQMQSSAASVRTMGLGHDGRTLPGGVL